MCCEQNKGQRKQRGGFSLVELMVVIVLIGLLAGMVTFGVRSYMIAGKRGVAKFEIAKISEAADSFYTHYGRYPTSEEGIAALAEKTDDFPDGLLDKMPRDPWGNAYEYVSPGHDRPYNVTCYGADGLEGGSGADKDISNASLETP